MIQHEGIIQKIDGNHITVRVLQLSACSDCHVKEVCIAADSKEKFVDVFDTSGQFKVDDRVLLEGKTSIGYKAILWAFVIPLVLLVTTLIATTSVWNFSESSAALSAIVVLIPYYIVLSLLREKLSKKFIFSLRKLN